MTDKRWIETADEEGIEGRAARLFSDASSAPDSLGNEAFERIRGNLRRPRRTLGTRTLVTAILVATLVGGVGGASASTWYVKTLVAAQKLMRTGSAEIFVVKSGTIIAQQDEKPVSVRQGHVALRTKDKKAFVETPDMKITIAEKSVAEVSVEGNKTRRIGAIDGKVSAVSTTSPGKPIELAAGKAWTDGRVSDLSDSRRAWARNLFTPDPMESAKSPETNPVSIALSGPGKASPKKGAEPDSWARVEVESDAKVQARGRELFARGLEELRKNDDAERALDFFDDYAELVGSKPMPLEAVAARTEAQLKLSRHTEALAALDKAKLDKSALGLKLLVRRGELRALSRRCPDALADFNKVLASKPHEPATEKALWGRSVCRTRLGNRDGAIRDLRAYTERYPQGEHFDEASARLSPVPMPED